MCRKFAPEEKEISNEEDMEMHFIKTLRGREEMEIVMTLTSFLSHRTTDEIYLGQRQQSKWSDNKDVQDKFNALKNELVKIEERILLRNKDYLNQNRWGTAKALFKLLYPDTSKVDSKGGITMKGIPNNISI
ncbi:hypothetical protein SLEP1_g42437 [Rubroshorea leprosula]|uniref:Lipoxygenase domain-containing protein n=1 Tax=Rubroshorea leprosula TaxID=152421 RepID=A0AAV5L9T4_9ROSI|nr:hypothetical protein SLEP1_g42437 [Rubroshorea leprosula]